MKLRNRLFLAFFLFAFLPVAIISLVSLELALNSLDRITSPGIDGALSAADSLVELSLHDLENRCRKLLAGSDVVVSPEEYLRLGFDVALLVRGPDKIYSGIEQAPDTLWKQELLSLVESVDSGETSGRAVVLDNMLVYSVRHFGDEAVLAGFIIDERYRPLYEDLGANLHRFGQLKLLKRSGKKFMRSIWGAANAAYLLIIILVTRATARSLTRPLSKLSDLTELVGPGNWDVRLKYDRKDEISSLVEGFNRMSSRLSDTTQKLIEVEKAAAWQQTARVIAHGIKNILAPVKLALARLSKRMDTEDRELRSPLGTIQTELELLEKTARDFSTYGRPAEGKVTDINLNTVAKHAIRICEADCSDVDVRLSLDDHIPSINADQNLLREALVNLIKNACEAAGRGGKVTVSSSATTSEVSISVSDDGGGISPDIRDRLFEPYATTKPGGTGLGLAIAERSVASSGGTITYETSSQGTTFTIVFGVESETTSV